VKTSGSKGLHLSVPLKHAGQSPTRRRKSLALALGQLLESRDPNGVHHP